MKQTIVAAILAVAVATPAFAADVGISLSVSQPGFYGQVNIGNVAPPVIYKQPVIVQQGRVKRPPIYLHVPPGYEKHWSRHCHEYHACGERVYFVQDKWYRHEYERRHREQSRRRHYDERRDRGYDRGREHGNGHYGQGMGRGGNGHGRFGRDDGDN